MKDPGHVIVKSEVTSTTARLTLANGVTIDLSSNKGYVHMSFSGIKFQWYQGNSAFDQTHECLLIAGGFHNHLDLPHVKLANYVDITYNPHREE